MITLYVLGSGSRGNCFAVESEGVALLIDAGFSAREIERRAERAGLDLSQVAGIVLTHEHGDHACGAPLPGAAPASAGAHGPRYLAASGSHYGGCRAPCRSDFAPEWSWAPSPSRHARRAMMPPSRSRSSSADPREPASGLLMTWAARPPQCVTCFATSRAIVLEANHDEVQLRTSDYPPVVQRRIAGSAGHLSNRAAAELLADLHHPGLLAVVLAHLSQQCNTAAEARATVARALRRVRLPGRAPCRRSGPAAAANSGRAASRGPARPGPVGVSSAPGHPIVHRHRLGCRILHFDPLEGEAHVLQNHRQTVNHIGVLLDLADEGVAELDRVATPPSPGSTTTTDFSTSLLVNAWKICGDAVPTILVTTTGPCWRLPVACPLAASRGDLTV